MAIKKEIILNSKELVEFLMELLNDDGYKKRKPLPKFTIQEARFIRDLIFNRPKELLFYYLADYIANVRRPIPFSAINMRRLKWLQAYLQTGNATEAARMSGYSKKCAKHSRDIEYLRKSRASLGKNKCVYFGLLFKVLIIVMKHLKLYDF